MTRYRTLQEHLRPDGSPKRIVSLDGIGRCGVLTE